MSKQDSNVSTIDDTRKRVEDRLHELRDKQSLKPLRDLFVSELNYDFADQRLNLSDEKSRAMVQENPRIIATGGNGDFKIVYVHLLGSLSLVNERTLISKLLRDQLLYALFIFSDAAQQRWHLVNVKEGAGEVKRRLFRRITIGPEEQLRTAIERIALLDLSTMSTDIATLPALTIQDAFDRAFDVEAVTKTFFREYRTAFDILQKDLRQQTGDEAWAHDYALQLLNRCMFLYFIQRKRWLGEDTEFLKTFWETYKRVKADDEPDTFVGQWLNTLFFKAFNNGYNEAFNHFPKEIDYTLSLAPYLNGGLFTENDLDKKEGFVVSDARFLQIFDLLQRYNFTIAEDSPLDQEVAVDPEMIGTVYESLVNVSTEIDERSDAGIFYTPRTEIDLMCRLSLVDCLTNHLGKAHKSLLYDAVFAIAFEDKELADQHLQENDIWRNVYNVLNNITMIDPACGSGSFLVGMLSVLDDLMERAVVSLGLEHSYSPYNAYERKKRIIGQSLYGVDVMEWAVHIAELRLWLALIVDAEYTRENLHVRTEPLLPYFTFKVRCGDSLVQEVGGIKLGLTQKQTLSPMLKRRVTMLRQQKLDFYNNKPSRELPKKEDVERVERELFKDILLERMRVVEEEKKKLTRQIEDVREQQLSLIESVVARPSAELLERLKRLAECDDELAQLKRTRDALQASKTLPFVWDIAFGEIFADQQRFDIVIGNPPYLRQEQIHTPYRKDSSKEDNKAYKTKLAHMVYELFPRFFGSTTKQGKQTVTNPINQKSDLYIYFYLLGLSLLNNKGSFCFITSNSWLDVGYGADLQEFLLKHCHIKLILDNETMRSFVSASVNTIIAHFSPPDERSDWGLEETAYFVMSRVPFEALLSPSIFRAIEATSTRQTQTAYRVFPINQHKLLEDGKVPLVESDDEEEEQESKQGKPSRMVAEATPPYTGNKWGGKYLRAPDIYWTIIEKGKDKLVRLGDVAEVRFGIKTGANKFFYLDSKKISQWGLEERFLKPVIQTPRECRSFAVDPQTLKLKIFMCHESEKNLKGTAAIKYIKWGETQGFNKGPSCANRARWWDVGMQSPFDFVALRFRDKRNWNPVNVTPSLLAGDVMFVGTWKNRTDVFVNNALANSTLSVLASEIYGRVNLGDGLLTTYGPEIAMFDFVKASLFNGESRQHLLHSFDVMARRDVKSIFDEVHQKDRINLDNIIFDALNLTQGERDAVYEAVVNLVNSRLKKAKSLNTSRETRKRIETVQKLTGVWVGVPDVEEEEEDEVLGGFSA